MIIHIHVKTLLCPIVDTYKLKSSEQVEIIIPRKAGYCNHLRVFVCLFVC